MSLRKFCFLPKKHTHFKETPPTFSLPSEFIPVYTVVLRRTDVITVRQRPTIHNPHDVATLLWDYLKDVDREHFVILILNTKNSVTSINTVSIDILDSALVHPREVLKMIVGEKGWFVSLKERGML